MEAMRARQCAHHEVWQHRAATRGLRPPVGRWRIVTIGALLALAVVVAIGLIRADTRQSQPRAILGPAGNGLIAYSYKGDGRR